MMPGVPSPPGAEMAEAFIAAMQASLDSTCDCQACRILRAASRSWRARLAQGGEVAPVR